MEKTAETTDYLARPLAATKSEIRNPKFEYRILNKELRMSKDKNVSSFEIPCSVFDIRISNLVAARDRAGKSVV